MKKIVLIVGLAGSLFSLKAQNVGIGTSSPKAAFNIADGRTVLFGSDTSGFGMKFIWYSRKGALRAGYAFGSGGYDIDNSWDIANVGIFSTAFGTATIAKGNASMAMGEGTIAGSTNSVAMGRYNMDVPNAALMIGNGFDDYGTAIRSNVLTVLNDGRIGIGNGAEFPKQALDIAHGRLRFTGSYAGQSSGIEFTNIAGNTVLGLIGMKDDNTVGMYSISSGWNFNHNLASGNTGLGADAGSAKLTINGGSGNALEINGGIKVAGNNKPAFQLTVDAINQIISGGNIIGFTIDNALCNNDPNALIFITPIAQQIEFSVSYDGGTGKWKCYGHSLGLTNYTTETSQVRLCDISCINLVYVTGLVTPTNYIAAGYKFNILIIKQ